MRKGYRAARSDSRYYANCTDYYTNEHPCAASDPQVQRYGRTRMVVAFTGWLLAALLLAPVAFGQGKTTVSGLTEPIKDVILSSEVGGEIETIHYKEGDAIAKGSVILELKKKFEELEVQRRKLIWESKAEVTSAAEKVAALKIILETARSLFERTGSVSKEEIDQRELEYKLAIAEEEQLRIAEERERIEYNMAIETLEKLILKSPFKGVITELLMDEGENCEPRQPLVHVVDYSKCIMVCYIEAPLGENLKKGQAVDLQAPVGSRTIKKKGTIIFVSPVVDPASGLLTVKAEFDNPDGAVRPGVTATMGMP